MRVLSLCLLVSCTGDSDDTDTDTTDGAPTFEDYVYVTDPYVGDTTCYDGAAWIEQTVAAGCMAPLAVTGTITDFQEDEPVSEATVKLWPNDDITTAAASEATAGGEGTVSVTIDSCSPFGYGTFTPPEWEETVDTYEVHSVYDFEPTGATSEVFNSVSVTTSVLIPSLIGLNWDTNTGIIAGTAYDCGENGITNAQVFIKDAVTGAIPESPDPAYPFGVFYFTDNDLPTRNEAQPWTSVNGLWTAVNLPSGTFLIEMWVHDGTAHKMLGSTVLTVNPGSVNISNIFTGRPDGIYYPAACLAECVSSG